MTSQDIFDHHDINADWTALSHWTYFPPVPEKDRFASPQTFRVLVASRAGRFAIATVSLRTAPDARLVANLASLIDDPKFTTAPNDLVVGEYWRRTGQAIDLHDIDLDQDDPITLTTVIPRAIARLALAKPIDMSTGPSLIQTRAELTLHFGAVWLSCRAKFISGLTQDAVAHSRGIDGLRPSTYALLNSTQDPIVRRYRIQALTLWPILQPVLLSGELSRVLAKIDAGQPLIIALADHYRVPQVMIRVLREVRPETLGSLSQNLRLLFELLREIPVDFYPRDTATWGKFVAAVDTIKKVSHREINSSANKLWLRHCAWRRYKLPVRSIEDLLHIGQQIDVFLAHLRETLSWAVAQARREPFEMTRQVTEVVSEFKAELGLDGLAQLARRFDDAYRTAYDAFAQEAELWVGVRWPSVADGTHTFGEISVIQLLTPEELRREGEEMGHCVAVYVQYCVTGKSQIWSVRDKDGQRLATLDTYLDCKPNGFLELNIRQCVGRFNTTASQAAMAAANDLVKTLSDDPHRLVPFGTWMHTVRRKSLSTRQRHALMQPTANAFNVILSGKYSWPRIIEMVKPK